MDLHVVTDLEDEPGGLESSLVVRTDFSDQAAWLRTQTALMQPGRLGEDAQDDGDEDFGPALTFVDHPRFDGFTAQQFVAEVARMRLSRNHLFFADRRAQIDDDHPVVALDLEKDAPGGEENAPGRSFRVRAYEVGSVGANLSLINMDFREFADATPDGVFRGFQE
ncbi:hypothetical protein ABLG96_18125 [Nakamurella sp. A5-74]|uniref:DUF6924 domain-containing protein n=1 Tax=Nakamurella sp. A5-74 TaxID=3158264 RepID=A0AAU8DMU7_9ACTN